jgi:hypothetical protein
MAGKTDTSTTEKTRHVDIIAGVITELGKGKPVALKDIAKHIEEKKLLPKPGESVYRTCYGIILRDKGKTVVKVDKGTFKVAKKS